MTNNNDPEHIKLTMVSLKEHFEKLLEELDKRMYQSIKALELRVFQAISALELRIEQARQSMEKRLDGMNEFRKAIDDQTLKFPTKNEITADLDALKKDIRALNTFKDSTSGLPGDVTGLRKDIDELKTFRATMDGKATQKDMNTTRTVTYISLALAVIGLLYNILRP